MISFVIAVAAIAAMALVMGALARVKEAEMENKWIQEYTESVGELCDSLEEQKESVRRYYHDLSKHMRTLEVMIERQKDQEYSDGKIQIDVQSQSAASLEKLKQFYESLHDAPGEADICPDEVINAILLSKMQQCRELQIPFHICASIPEEREITDAGMAVEKPEWISDSDMAAILLNLLDNAIEAQTRIPPEEPRWIWLSIGIGDEASSDSFASSDDSGLSGSSEASGLPESSDLSGVSESPASSSLSKLSVASNLSLLSIEVKNKIRADEKISFQTRKSSPSEHGFGLRIIDSVIEKYHGRREVQIDEEQHMFITRVIFSGESL